MFVTSPAFGIYDFRSETMDRSILRTTLPEAFVTLDGTLYSVGGLVTAGHHSYFNRSNTKFNVSANAFNYVGYRTRAPEAPFHWEPGLRHSPTTVSWPPKGLKLTVEFQAPTSVARPEHANVTVYVNYEMYVGIPLVSKWLTVSYSGTTPVRVDSITVEYLGVQKPYVVENLSQRPSPWDHDASAGTSSWLYIETNEPHGTQVIWGTDPASPDSPGADEPVLNCTYTLGPGVVLGDTSHWAYSALRSSRDTWFKSQFVRGGSRPSWKSLVYQENRNYEFDTFHVLELVTDSGDRERVALSRHRMTRLLAPQTQENPIFFHGTDWNDEGYKIAIDQLAEVGFEMFVIDFRANGSLVDLSDKNIDFAAANVQYARDKGIEVGG